MGYGNDQSSSGVILNVEDASTTFAIWNPPTQPASADIIALNNRNPADYIALWEGLRSAFPAYISRESLGKDTSNTYDIWKYVFAPPHYEKTVIITSNVHGGETEGQKLLYRFLRHLCYDYKTSPQLNYLRNKVRLVVIPLANPYGLTLAARKNVNGVDINRNFTYGWNSFTSTNPTDETYKGTAALSEKESQYIDAVMSQYVNDGAVAFFDIHNTPTATPANNTALYYVAAPKYANTVRNTIHQVANSVAPSGFVADTLVETLDQPTSFNQASCVYNIHGIGPEWKPGGVYGVTAFSAEDVTQGVKFLGNIILQYASLQPMKFTALSQPWCAELSNIATTWSTNATPGTYEDIPETQFTFSPKSDGILFVSAELTFVNNTAASINYFVPVVFQDGNFTQTSTTAATQQARHEAYCEPNGKRATISASRAVPIYAKGNPFGDVTVKLQCKADVGQILHRRSKLHIMFVPADSGLKYTQKCTDGGGIMAQYWPQTVS